MKDLLRKCSKSAALLVCLWNVARLRLFRQRERREGLKYDKHIKRRLQSQLISLKNIILLNKIGLLSCECVCVYVHTVQSVGSMHIYCSTFHMRDSVKARVKIKLLLTAGASAPQPRTQHCVYNGLGIKSLQVQGKSKAPIVLIKSSPCQL